MRAMSVLGALYAAGFVLILAFSALIDGGKCARLYLMGAPITSEMLQEGDFQLAILVVSALYLPLSLLFWHAPALVHNIRAFMVFGLAWTGMFLIFGIIMAMLGAMMGSAEAVAAMLYPAVMLVLAMFFTSIYFTFRDSFEFPTGEDA